MDNKKKEAMEERLRTLATILKPGNFTEEEISCEECQNRLAGYVEAEINGEEVSTRFPEMWRHLQRCDRCGALYADLIEIEMLEQSEQFPQPVEIPEPDLSFLSTSRRNLREIVSGIATRIADEMLPAAQENLQMVVDAFFERIEDLSGDFEIRSTSALALAFGAEGSESLIILAATFTTTQTLLEIEKPWRREQINKIARREARRMGFHRRRAKRFAESYTSIAQEYLSSSGE